MPRRMTDDELFQTLPPELQNAIRYAGKIKQGIDRTKDLLDQLEIAVVKEARHQCLSLVSQVVTKLKPTAPPGTRKRG